MIHKLIHFKQEIAIFCDLDKHSTFNSSHSWNWREHWTGSLKCESLVWSWSYQSGNYSQDFKQKASLSQFLQGPVHINENYLPTRFSETRSGNTIKEKDPYWF